MKICYLANAKSIHTLRWVKHFAQHGHEVHLISRYALDDNDIGNAYFHKLITTRSWVRLISFAVELIPDVTQIKNIIRRVAPDIVHAHWAVEYGLFGALSGFHPFILSAWGGDIEKWPKQSNLIRLGVKLALAKADVILTTSNYLKEYSIEEFDIPKYKVKALPWGVDLSLFRSSYLDEARNLRSSLGITDTDFVILSPRHLQEHYRIDGIVEAIPYIIAEHANVTLIVLQGAAESGQFENRIESLIEQLDIDRNVKLIRRHLTPQEMAVVYNASDAFISIPKTDQFASSIQEGMACGTIPIVGDLEVYRQYLTDGENALFVDPNNPKDIADKVIYCIEHPELKQRFYAINRKIIEENEDWAKNAAKVEELYQSLVQRISM
jgi:glycosyltransferase involved in cell wall biosynthesis